MDMRLTNPRDAGTGLYRVEARELDTDELLLAGPKRKSIESARRAFLLAVVGSVRHGLRHGCIPPGLAGMLRQALGVTAAEGGRPRSLKRAGRPAQFTEGVVTGDRLVKVPPITGWGPKGVA